MTRLIPPVICGLAVFLTATLAHARADHQEAPRILAAPTSVEQINWGGVVSRGRMKISGLPAIQSAREAARAAPGARLRTRKGTRSAPGERLNRPTFGGGARDKSSGLPTGKRRHKPITLRKRVDRASPMLRRAHAAGRILPRVVMKGRGSSGAYYQWDLRRVRITSYSVSGSGQTARETVQFTYDSVGNLTTRTGAR